MNVIFQDLQDVSNPANGTCLRAPGEVTELLRRLGARPPFLAELRGENGFSMTIGLAGDLGCVQFSSTNGEPPYWMALPSEIVDAPEFVEFLAGGTPTPIPARYCLRVGDVEKIVTDFLATGTKSTAAEWEEI